VLFRSLLVTGTGIPVVSTCPGLLPCDLLLFPFVVVVVAIHTNRYNRVTAYAGLFSFKERLNYDDEPYCVSRNTLDRDCNP